jgi:hypothetical protein
MFLNHYVTSFDCENHEQILGMLTKLLLIYFWLNLLENALAERVQVETKFGELNGFLSEPFYGGKRAEIYLNIPYALPPTGARRFEVSYLKHRFFKECAPFRNRKFTI